METQVQTDRFRWPVLLAAGALLAAWVAPRFGELVSVQNGGVRFPLCLFLAALVLLRRPPPGEFHGRPPSPAAAACAGCAGAVLAVLGLVLNIRIVEWSGVLLLVGACLRWALPPARAAAVPAALLVLFWAHPVPGRMFAPLQFGMQHLSVRGSEWLLHVLNQRVWADGFVLHTGLTTYEVPAWCSGMRTATTVMLAALGMAALKRLSLAGTLLLVTAALTQALALNVIRIAFMVIFVPVLAGATGVSFLHDSAGAIVVLAVLLSYGELLAVAHLEHARQRRRAELNARWMRLLSAHPPIWRLLIQHRWRIAVAIAGLCLLATLAYKGRRAHRAEMIKGVVTAFIDTRAFEQAKLAARAVQDLMPDDRDWRFAMLRILLLRGEYDRVIKGLDAMDIRSADEIAQRDILMAYCLMAQGQLAAAAERLRHLPAPFHDRDPRVAMIRAELARASNDPDAVAAQIAVAADWAPNRERIRGLYPYLRTHRQWAAIAGTDLPSPYRNPAEALCAAEAAMNLNHVPRAAALTLNLLARMPDDPRLLEPLFFLAAQNLSGPWESRFADHLLRAVQAMRNPDDIYRLFDKCYALGRPDLMWQLHQRVQTLDPTHPGLLVNAAENARRWFLFRRQTMGFESPQAHDLVDLRAAYRQIRGLSVWAAPCANVPYGLALSAPDTVAARQDYLARALAEFRRRAAGGALSMAMHYEYVRALELSGDGAAAETELAALAAAVPSERRRTQEVLSEICERQGDWQRVYEILRVQTADGDCAPATLLRLARAQAHLRLGIGAILTARRVLQQVPASAQAVETLASVLAQFDSAEDALQVLERPRPRDTPGMSALEARLLFTSQRFTEAASFARAARLPPPVVASGTRQRPYLPPAERALLWYQLILPSEKEFALNAAALERNRHNNTSPFLANLTDLWLSLYRSQGADGTAETSRWVAAGRDALEQAQLLNQLALLLCRRGRGADARRAALQAAALQPAAPLLWRLAVSLAGPDRRVLAAARRACPDDSELWLCDLVVTSQCAAGLVPAGAQPASTPERDALPAAPDLPADSAAWLAEQVAAAARANRFSPAAMTRAADYLYRGGYRATANVAARNAAARARGLLPAYVIGLRCAITERDRVQALDCARNAIGAALAPPPVLFEKFVGVKSAEDPMATDNEMVEALKVLRREDPRNPLWAQMLGYVRFQRGGWELTDALAQMSAALDCNPTNRMPYLVASEAARQLDRLDRAADILRTAVERFPDDVIILNNLIYTLALQADTIPDALDRLPVLLVRARGDVRVMDTASAVYTRSGLLDQADVILEQILRLAPAGTAAWFRAQTRKAEVLLLRGEVSAAVDALTQLIGRSAGIGDEEVLVATRLIEEARARQLRDAQRTVVPGSVPVP